MTEGRPRREVIFHRLAGQEYRRARRWYGRQGGFDLADGFRDEIDAAVRRIAEDAQIGPVFRKQYQWVRLHRFPYLLYYRILNDDRVLVLAVAHASRRPGYWLHRAKP